MKHLICVANMIHEAGLAIAGASLFIGTFPPVCDSGVMLRSPLTGDEIDEGQGGFFNTSFMVIVRAENPQEGYEICLAISKALKIDHRDIEDMHVIKMAPETLPITYPRGDADTLETSVRMRIAFGDSQLI